MNGIAMTIKSKLICNALLTLAGIAIIGGVSLLGMKFVQGKLFVLTERSTPFQLKTIEMQRSLQEHTANLLEVAFATTGKDLAESRSRAESTLADLGRVSGELGALKADGKDDSAGYAAGRLESLTGEMFSTTEARLKAEEAGRVADQAMKAELEEITRKLSELDLSIQKKQKSSARQLSASSGSASEITLKLMNLTSARDLLKDANYALSEILKATGRKQVIIARGKLDAALSQFGKNRLVAGNDPSVKESAEAVVQVKKLVAGPGGLLELKGAVLSKGADASVPEYDQAAQNVASKLANAVIDIEQSVAMATGRYTQESRSHEDSLKGSNQAGDVLAMNGTLTSLGLDIKSTIRELFAAKTQEELNQLAGELEKQFAAAAAVQQRMAPLLSGNKAELAVLRGVGGMLARLKGQLLSKDGVVDKLNQVVRVRAQASALNLKLKELVAEQNEQGKRGVSAAQSEQEKAVASVNRMVKTFVAAISLLGLGMMVFGLVTSLLLARAITNPIRDLSVLAEGFGRGDFSGKLDTKRKDEFGALGRHFNQATVKLEEITAGLTRAIAKLADHARHLSGTAEELSRGAREQALASEQSAAAMTQISQSINEVAGGAAQAADASQKALATATRGGAIVTSSAQGMEQIAATVREATALVQNLGERSEQVGSIIDIINDIADQTSLLALNASIEAARAGEMGMGFAVVADEVRKLATRTTEATSEIASMIKEIQDGTARSVRAMAAGNDNVADGVLRASEASRTLEEILEVSNTGAAMAERIAAAAEEQSTAVVQISASMDGMADITRRAEGATLEVSRSSRELQSIADELSGMAAWFRQAGRQGAA